MQTKKKDNRWRWNTDKGGDVGETQPRVNEERERERVKRINWTQNQTVLDWVGRLLVTMARMVRLLWSYDHHSVDKHFVFALGHKGGNKNYGLILWMSDNCRDIEHLDKYSWYNTTTSCVKCSFYIVTIVRPKMNGFGPRKRH